jgi:protein-S-isoprenylcysteine O-methyltransferase Ste14
VLRLLAVVGSVLATLAHNVTAAAFPYSTPLLGISLCFIWAGIGLRLWSFKTLGRYFTFTVMTSRDQPVINSGPYRVLRHPSYAAILLILAGIGISLANWLSLAALIGLPLIGLLNRIRVEEAVLSATLGDRYTMYASGRKRLIPFVW